MDEMRNQNRIQLREQLIDTVTRQIQTYPIYTAKMRLKDMLKKCMGKKTAPIDRFFWPHAMLSYALMEAHKATGSAEALQTLEAYADRYLKAGVPVYYADNVMNGEVLLYLYRLNGKEEYLRAAEKLAAYVGTSRDITRQLMDEKYPTVSYYGSLIYRQGNPTHVYVDALGMVCPMLVHIDRMQSGEHYAQMSLRLLQNFMAKGMDEATGLPYHGYDLVSGEKMGIIGWGRAVGWLLMALSGSLQYLMQETTLYVQQEQAQYAAKALARDQAEGLRQQFEQLLRTAFSYQKEDGLFAWQLQAVEGPYDTSATAMILYAAKQGMQSGILKEEYREAVKHGEQGLCSRIKNGTVGQSLAECMGFAQYPQVYGAYPWGVAMTCAVLFMGE